MLAVSVTVAAVPVPLRETEVGDPGALLVIEMPPVRVPAVVGANKTLKVAVPPALILAGRLMPVTLKAEPVTPN